MTLTVTSRTPLVTADCNTWRPSPSKPVGNTGKVSEISSVRPAAVAAACNRAIATERRLIEA